jgi:hypothetical protein
VGFRFMVRAITEAGSSAVLILDANHTVFIRLAAGR